MVFVSSLKLFLFQTDSFRSSVVVIHTSHSFLSLLFIPRTEMTRQYFLSYVKNTDEVDCFCAITSIWPVSLFDCSSHSLKMDCCLHIPL